MAIERQELDAKILKPEEFQSVILNLIESKDFLIQKATFSEKTREEKIKDPYPYLRKTTLEVAQELETTGTFLLTEKATGNRYILMQNWEGPYYSSAKVWSLSPDLPTEKLVRPEGEEVIGCLDYFHNQQAGAKGLDTSGELDEFLRAIVERVKE